MTKIDVTVGAWGLYNYYRMEVSVFQSNEMIVCIFTVLEKVFSMISDTDIHIYIYMKFDILFVLDLEGETQRAVYLIYELGPHRSGGKSISGNFFSLGVTF